MAEKVLWGTYDVFLGVVVPEAPIVDALYFGFPICFIVGTWYFRTRTPSTDDAFVQLGNLGIIISAILLIYLFAYTGFLRAELPTYLATVTGACAILNLSSPLFGLIVLSLHTWGRRRHVMLLIVAGLAFHASGEVAYIGQLMGDGYRADSLVSGLIPLGISFITWAAFEQCHLEGASASDRWPAKSESLAKQGETLLPSLAVAGVLVVALVQRDKVVADLISAVVAASFLFICSLGARNWWGHRFERRLRAKAVHSQAALEATNRELAMQNLALRSTQQELEQSQGRLALHQEQLEELVEERTRELEDSRHALHKADRLASLGTLAAGLAHELNNPLGMMQLRADEALLVPEKNRYSDALRDMLEQLQRCAEIVRGVLRFSRDEASEKQVVVLRDVAQRSVELARYYANQAGVEIRWQSHAEVGRTAQSGASAVWGNATELEQVIVNLLRNAIEASDKGARVDLKLARVAGLLRLAVVDEGAGMTDETQEHAFDPFYTTRRDDGGTGLGLSIAHGIVTRHGGSIQVQSREGKGTTVTVELAAHQEG